MNQRKRRLFDHVVLHVKDIHESKKFYRAIVETLGHTITEEAEGGFFIGELEVRQNVEPTKSVHLAFLAEHPWSVNLFHETALKAGGIPLSSPSQMEGRGIYTANVMDPDGNNIEAIYKESQRNISISY